MNLIIMTLKKPKNLIKEITNKENKKLEHLLGKLHEYNLGRYDSHGYHINNFEV